MPRLREGMKSIESSVPKSWLKKIKKVRKKKGMSSRRQYIRDLVYDNLKKEGEL